MHISRRVTRVEEKNNKTREHESEKEYVNLEKKLLSRVCSLEGIESFNLKNKAFEQDYICQKQELTKWLYMLKQENISL